MVALCCFVPVWPVDNEIGWLPRYLFATAFVFWLSAAYVFAQIAQRTRWKRIAIEGIFVTAIFVTIAWVNLPHQGLNEQNKWQWLMSRHHNSQ